MTEVPERFSSVFSPDRGQALLLRHPEEHLGRQRGRRRQFLIGCGKSATPKTCMREEDGPDDRIMLKIIKRPGKARRKKSFESLQTGAFHCILRRRASLLRRHPAFRPTKDGRATPVARLSPVYE
jgi:hypothetical protein